MLPITDIKGNTELLTGIKGLKRKRKVNGEKSLAFFVVPDNSNEHSYSMVDAESTIEFDGEEYIIKKTNEKNLGTKTIKHVEAIHRFFHDLINAYQYQTQNGSMTFDAALSFIFGPTDYTYIIVDTFYAESFQNFGQDNCLALFKKVLERYGSEFRLVGNTVYLEREIGSKTDFQYRYTHNVKTIDKQIETHRLATIIKGFGGTPDENGIYPIQETYTSPNLSKFGELHAPAIYDERLSTVDGMQKRLKESLIDEPQLSITVSFVDLRAAGYNFDYANEGDYGFIIYEPMSLDMEGRIIEIDEDFDANLKPIKTAVTLSNLREKATDAMTRFSETSKSYNDLMDGKGRIPYNVLDDAVKIATEALQSAQTELEFNNGIIARDKNNPNLLVLFNSNGVGISTDGGQTFTTAMTGNGIVADVITAGVMSFNRARGGTLQLGGYENTNGNMQVLNSDGEVIADLDGERGGFSGLMIGNLVVTEDIEAPNIVKEFSGNLTYRVRGTAGSDDNSGIPTSDTDWESALYSAQEAIRRLPKFINGTITIEFSNLYDISENLIFQGFTGGGTITLDLRGNTLKGYVKGASCNLRIVVTNFKLDRNVGTVYCIDNETSPYLYLENGVINGNGHSSGIRTWRNGATYLTNVEIYNVQDCIRGSSLGRIYAVNCKGLGSRYGVAVETGAVASIANTVPMGEVANTYDSYTSQILMGAPTPDSGTATPPAPPVVEITKTWKSLSSKSWRDNWGWRTDGDEVYQGEWSGYGHHKGLWFFGSDMRNTLNGKTIKRIRMKIKRQSSGGYSNTVNAIVRLHQHASQPSIEPTMSSANQAVGFKWGESKWFTVSSEFHSLISNGTWFGFGIYTTSTSNADYMIFDTICEIEVTYEDVA